MPMYPSAFATVLITRRQKLFGIAIAIAALLIIAPPLMGPLKSRFKPLISGGIESSAGAGTHPEGEAGRKALSVKEFGAKGNGVADDTAAIQAAIAAAPKESTLYFPVGTYMVSNLPVNNRSGLSFVGEGFKSVVKRKADAARIATVEGSSDIVMRNLAFDANGIDSFGGVAFYAVNRVRIAQTHFFDSKPKPLGSNDRYSYVFARGNIPSEDIQIVDNVIEDLQLEVDHAKNVVIDGNRVSRAVRTAGIGIFTVANNTIAEDIIIARNTIIDPIGVGFNVGIDPPTDHNCIFRRIHIIGNKIIRMKTANYAIRIGTPNNSIATMGNVFEDIAIKNNFIQIDMTGPVQMPIIFANASRIAGIVFNRLIVTGNEIQSKGAKGSEYAIDLRQIQYSTVASNSVKGVGNGISLAGDLLHNNVRDNLVEASGIAYQLSGSLGGNSAQKNRVLGNPKTRWNMSELAASDIVEK
jgi:Pectate lyase superfamily protein